MWIKTNPNPCGRYVGDCVIRALSIAFHEPWNRIYVDICIQGFLECDMPSANHVWGKYLASRGYQCSTISGLNDMTIASFADSHPKGKYILGTGNHVVTVIDGDYYDAWDSGNEVPIYIWEEM